MNNRVVDRNLLWLKGQFALSSVQAGLVVSVLPFVVSGAASSTLREPAQTLRYPAACMGASTNLRHLGFDLVCR